MDVIDKYLDIFANLLGDKEYFVGEKVTIADIAVFNYLDNFVKGIDKAALDSRKQLEDFRYRLAGTKGIAAYLASDRRPALTLPPFVGILCTPEACK